MRDDDITINSGSSLNFEIDADRIKELKEAMEEARSNIDPDWRWSNTGGYVPTTPPIRPGTFPVNNTDKQIHDLQHRVSQLEDRVRELMEILNFFKPFLPDKKE